MVFWLRSVALLVALASASVAAFGVGVAYKVVGLAKRLANWASEPRDGARQRSVADELRLPGAPEAPPAVHVQMIRNWTEVFAEAHVDPQTARIGRALGRLDRLDREVRRLRTAAGFEGTELARVRRKLYRRGAGLASAATQTPAPRPVLHVEPHHVRFVLPLPGPWRENLSVDTSSAPNVNSYVHTPSSYFTYVLSTFRMFIDFFANSNLLQMIVTKIAQWSMQLLSINIVADLAQDTTTMEFHVLPFIPRRFFD